MNPTKGYFELFDQESWCPFLTINSKGKEEPWLSNIGSFCYMGNMKKPLGIPEIKRIEDMIYSDMKLTLK